MQVLLNLYVYLFLISSIAGNLQMVEAHSVDLWIMRNYKLVWNRLIDRQQ